MFSVIIPIYNKLPHLERSVQSVLQQSFENFELILVNDGSDDGSENKIYDFKDPRIRVFHREKPVKGGYAARNLGIEASKYNWICFLDADDSWEKDFLKMNQQLINQYTDISLFCSSWRIKTSDQINVNNLYKKLPKNTISLFSYYQYLSLTASKKPPINTIVTVCKKASILCCGKFPVNKCKVGGDVDTWLRLIKQEKRFVHINRIEANYYLDSVNRTNTYSNLGTGCIISTCNSFINSTNDKKEIRLLKKFSNRFLYYLIIKKILLNEKYSDLLTYFYKEKNFFIYIAFKISQYSFLYRLARLFMRLKIKT
ncbi:MAG: glycosyltransferase [Balneolaceae bacterium]|nr:glycosyltransferase [Balneolaceae bacterium]